MKIYSKISSIFLFFHFFLNLKIKTNPGGFNSLNHYDDINSSASSMNSFSFKNDLSNSNNNTNNNRDNSNYGLNSYSDFDYLNLENLIIPPLSSSSSVQSIVSSQFAGSRFL